MPPAGASFGALRYRNFRLFIVGQFVSLCGSWMQLVALGWLALVLSNSAFKVGLVTALGALPVLLFTLYGGVVADRVNKRRALILLESLLLVEAHGRCEATVMPDMRRGSRAAKCSERCRLRGALSVDRSPRAADH